MKWLTDELTGIELMACGKCQSVLLRLKGTRLGRLESAFTLIELNVALLVLAILIAIAIPTFLAARQREADKKDPPSGLVVSKHHEPAHSSCSVVGKMMTCDNDPEKWTVTVQKCRGSGPPSKTCTERELQVTEWEWAKVMSGRTYVESGVVQVGS